MMQKNAKMKCFEELALNLQREGFTIGPEENDFLPFEPGMTLGGEILTGQNFEGRTSP